MDDKNPMNRTPSRRGVMNFVAGIASLGALALLFVGIRGSQLAFQQNAWRPVDAEVLEVVSAPYHYHSDGPRPGDRTGTRIAVTYRYNVDGERFTSNQYSLTEAHDDRPEGDEESAARRFAELRSKKQLEIFVDPGDPTRSVIAKEEAAPAIVVTVLGATILIGALLVVVRRARRDP